VEAREKSGKKLGGVCQKLMKLEKRKDLSAKETKRLKECTQVRNGIHNYIVAESKKFYTMLQSLKLMKDTDLGAFGSAGRAPLMVFPQLPCRGRALRGVHLAGPGARRR